MSTYLINSLWWSAVGFAAGFGTAQLSGGVAVAGRIKGIRPNWRQVLGTVIVLMSLISMLTVARYAQGLRDQTQRLDAVIACEGHYFTAYTDALKARDESAQQARDTSKEQALATKNLWLEFLKNAPDRAADRPTEAQRNASLAALNRWMTSVDGFVVSIDKSSQAKLTYPIPDNRCPS
jgi:nitrate/nitrite-specific signal transduction histidine kinase